VTTALRDAQQATACEVFRLVTPDSPTLCEGWSAFDLAAHLWTLNHDLLAWPAVGISALDGWGRRRLDRVKERYPYPQLVTQLESGSGAFACMPGDRLEGHRHSLGEWFVHTEDVRRANGLDVPTYADDLQEALWRRLRVAARALSPWRGLRFVTPSGASARTGLGTIRATVHGEPAELLLWLYGRRDAADVEME